MHDSTVLGTTHRAAAAAVLAGVLGLASVPARATCGSASCFLVTDTQEGIGLEGNVHVDLSFRFVNQSRRLSGTHSIDEVLTPKIDFENGQIEPDHHREIRTQNTLVQLDLAYGVTDRLTVGASLPLLTERDHEHYDDVGTPDEHFTSADGTRGFGDIQIGARYGILVKTKDLLVGGLTVKLPTGAYRLRDGEGAINEPTIQPGTGSTDWIGSVQYAHQIIPLRFEWFVTGSYRLNTENDLEYRLGREVLVSAGLGYRFAQRFTWSVQINGRRAGRDRFLGDNVPSTGSKAVYLTPGIRLTSTSGASLYGFVQLPVFQDVNEAQLVPRAGFVIGIAKVF